MENILQKSKFTRRTFLSGLAAAGAGITLTGSAKQTEGQEKSEVSGRKICIFTKHLQWLDYETMAETAAEIGFDGVDIPLRPKGHVLPEKVADDLPRAVEAVKKAGLDVPMITTAITGPDSPYAEQILKTAGGLGIGCYRLGYLNYDHSKGISESLESYKPQLRDLAQLNREYGIHGDYQNHAGVDVGATVWDIWYAIKDLDPRWIGCQYDIRHATAEGGNSWRLGLELISRFIKSTVIKDFKWGKVDGRWSTINTPVGEGMVDFKAYYELIKKLNVTGPVSMHFEYPHERKRDVVIPVFRKDLEALRSILKEAGL